MARISREASIDLSEFFCKFGFGDGDDALAVAVGEEWRDTVIEWLNVELEAANIELEAARGSGFGMHNPCEIVLQPTRDEDGEPLHEDERDGLDLSGQDMSEFLEKASAFGPALRDVLDRVNDRLEGEIPKGEDAMPIVQQLESRIVRIAALATGEEPRAKDKILAICEEALALIKRRGDDS
jgi:hypothetical protein